MDYLACVFTIVTRISNYAITLFSSSIKLYTTLNARTFNTTAASETYEALLVSSKHEYLLSAIALNTTRKTIVLSDGTRLNAGPSMHGTLVCYLTLSRNSSAQSAAEVAPFRLARAARAALDDTGS